MTRVDAAIERGDPMFGRWMVDWIARGRSPRSTERILLSGTRRICGIGRIERSGLNR